jgi:hypothetical protein
MKTYFDHSLLLKKTKINITFIQYFTCYFNAVVVAQYLDILEIFYDFIEALTVTLAQLPVKKNVIPLVTPQSGGKSRPVTEAGLFTRSVSGAHPFSVGWFFTIPIHIDAGSNAPPSPGTIQ